jgi:tetratricopeptide (TPR) repeat protein
MNLFPGEDESAKASDLIDAGHLEEALKLYQSVLDIQRKELGDTHAKVGTTYYNIGIAFYLQQKHAEAIEYMEKSLGIRIKARVDVGDTYYTLGLVYNDWGRQEKALHCYETAAKVQLANLGECHPSVGDTYNNMAAIYKASGQNAYARELYLKAFDVYRLCHGETHEDTLDAKQRAAAVSIGMFDRLLPLVWLVRYVVSCGRRKGGASAYKKLV